MTTPLLLAVDDDERSRCAVDRELRNRYEPDYEVISMGSAEAGLELLTRLADAGREVILVLADQCMPLMRGTEFLTWPRRFPPLRSFRDQPCVRKLDEQLHVSVWTSTPATSTDRPRGMTHSDGAVWMGHGWPRRHR